VLTIDGDFGGWAEANTKYFDENDGILTKIQAEAGQ
jgi:ABC-type sulfate transport system substrate-binding protein